MKCPYCGAEMEAGIIQSPHELAWNDKKYFAARARLHQGSVVLSELSMLKGSAVIAHCCRKCEKIVIDYRNGTCDMNRKNKY